MQMKGLDDDLACTYRDWIMETKKHDGRRGMVGLDIV